MPGKDIFLSYASEDRSRIRPLVGTLEGTGWTVFWDRTIPTGKTWPQILTAEIRSARSIVVVWSQVSVASEWVQEEASEGKKRNVLFPVRIDPVEPPFGYRQLQAADLVGWNGSPTGQAIERLVADLAAQLGEPPSEEWQTRLRDLGVRVQHAPQVHLSSRRAGLLAAFVVGIGTLVALAFLPSATSSRGDVILGIWQQQVFRGEANWTDVARVVVSKDGGQYVMGVQTQTQRGDLVFPYDIFDIRSDGNVWSFRTRWKDGSVADFQLSRVAEGIFEGDMTEGAVTEKNRWMKLNK